MTRLGAALASVFLILATAAPAAAQQPTPGADAIDLVGLVTRQPTPNSPATDVQFHTTINYSFQSAQNGMVLLFLFENSAVESTQQSSQGIPIKPGRGQLVLDIDYSLKPEVRTLTLVAALFKGEQKLSAWVSTNPIDMGPWPGRVAFEKAMAARLDNDLLAAEHFLNTAIDEAPETGNYYYWRGDTRVRLEQFAGAATDFTRSLELMPQDRASRAGRGISRLWLGDLGGAVEDLTLVIDSSATPDRITAWAFRARGLARSALGALPQAVADYQAYLELSPNAADRAQVEAWIKDIS